MMSVDHDDLFMTCHTQALTGVRLWYNF